MGKLLDIDFRKGSLIDQVSHVAGTPTDISFVQAEKGLAGSFNGSSSKIDIGLYTIARNSGAVEIAFKKRISGLTNVFLLGYNASSFKLVRLTAGLLQCESNTNGDFWCSVATDDSLWHHIVLSAVGGVVSVYFDGVLDQTVTPSDDVSFQYIGSYSSGGYFDGNIGKVTFWDTPLSVSQINSLYSDFLHSYPTVETKRNFVYPKPTDLSVQSDAYEGIDVIVNGGFDTDSDWIKQAGWTISGGKAVSAAATGYLGQASLSIGVKYRFTYTIEDYASGDIRAIAGTSLGTLNNGNGTYVEELICAGHTTFSLDPGTAFTGKIDNVSAIPLSGLVAAYNMIPSSAGILTDISGNGNDGTIVGAQQTVDGMYFDGVDDVVSRPIISSITYTLDYSIAIRFKVFGASGAILNNIGGVNDRSAIYIVAGSIRIGHWNGSSYNAKSTSYISDEYINLTFIHSASADNTLFVNGELATGVLNPASSTSGGFTLGDSGNLTAPLNCEIIDFKVYNRVLTLQEVQDYHNQFAERIYLRETFSDSGVGEDLPLGWQPGTGSYEVKELTTADPVLSDIRVGYKYLEGTTGGTIVLQSEQAYGTWEFDCWPNVVGFKPLFNFIADLPLSYNNPNQSGYYLFINATGYLGFRKTIAGAVTNLFFTADGYLALANWYRIKVTRDITGKFYVYIKGGTFGEVYTLVDVSGGTGTNPVTDNTHTTSKYTVIDLDIGDRFSNLIYRKGITQ